MGTSINTNKTLGVSSGSRIIAPQTSAFSNTKSIDFDGVDDMIPLASSVNMGQAGSLSFWFKRNGGTGVIMGEPSYTFKYLLYINGNTITIRCGANYRSFTSTASKTALNTTDWVHIVFTRDVSATDLKLYVDGALTETKTTFNSNDFLLGGIGGVPTMTFGGIACNIDEVSCYDAVLDATAVSNIYNSGTPTDLTGTSNLIAWYRNGDGDTFPTINDNVGSNNGTMTNMVSGDIVTDVP
tara:strand:- start:922 stop:1641 length:720 start_codon:yes stop_codon:yes gene_type:complete